jgi:hypothetical protein
LLELTLASKTEGQNDVVRVEVAMFNNNKTRSERLECDEVIGNPKNPSGYQFTNSEF